jgi:hypothetical protein
MAGPLVYELLQQLRQEYSELARKLEEMVLAEADPEEVDTQLVTDTEQFMTEALPEVKKIQTQLLLNMPRPDQP